MRCLVQWCYLSTTPLPTSRLIIFLNFRSFLRKLKWVKLTEITMEILIMKYNTLMSVFPKLTKLLHKKNRQSMAVKNQMRMYIA